MAPLEVDEDLIRRLSALLEETGLGEIEYAQGKMRVRVARGGGARAGPVSHGAPTIAADPAAEAAAPLAANTEAAVIAPMVGTVYVSPEPGAAPFVRPGDVVEEGQTLLLIEAMKTFNPIRAPRAGRVARVLVSDAMPVEYGEALVILE